jgi:hypothetical protein
MSRAGEHPERRPLFDADAPFSAHRLCATLCSPSQFGRASAPTIPQPVQNHARPRTTAGVGPTIRVQYGSWWHCQRDTASARTPLARMLQSVIGVAIHPGRAPRFRLARVTKDPLA